MAFFNNVGKVLTETGQGAVQKTKEMAEVVRLNSAIAEEEKKIDELIHEVGSLVVLNYEEIRKEEIISYVNEKYRKRANPDEMELGNIQWEERVCQASLHNEEYLIKIAEIKVCRENIFNCQEQIKVLKGITKCPGCGYDMPLGAAFCSNCGARMEENVQQVLTTLRLCPNCGTEVKEGVAFCTKCGSKLV